MKLRAALMRDLQRRVQARGWEPADAATALHVTQPRLSDLMRGKVSLFDLDALIGVAVAAGLRIEMRIAASG